MRDIVAGMKTLKLRTTCALLAFSLTACGGNRQPAESPDGESYGGDSPATESESAGGDTESASGSDDSGGSKIGDFTKLDTHTAKDTRSASDKTITPTKTEAAVKFVVIDREEGKPIPGIVVALSSPDGKKYYTKETDAVGYADVLVPIGKKYGAEFMSLGHSKIAVHLEVENTPRLTMKLTLRYTGYQRPKVSKTGKVEAQRLVLSGIEFGSGKATIRPGSFEQLDRVVEYLTHKTNAKLEISGHTDNVGNKKKNKALSTKRAEACRDYLVSKGIDNGRVEAVGYGDERPIASNDTPDGQQKNRRIEATEF